MSRWLKTGYHTQWAGAGYSYSVLYDVSPTYQYKTISNFLESLPLDRDPTDEGIPYPVTKWWNIEVWGFTQYFTANEGPLQITPRYNGPQNAWTSGNPDAVRTCPLRFRLRYQNESQRNRFVDVDVGAGIKLAICSDQCVVEGLIPQGSTRLNDGTPVEDEFTVPDGQTVAQSLVAGTISMMNVPVGDRFATLTEPLAVEAGQLGTVKVPAAAKKVTIVQAGPGTPGVFGLAQTLTDFVSGQIVGELAVNPLTRNTGKVELPGTACYVGILNPDPSVDRFFSLVFDLEF